MDRKRKSDGSQVPPANLAYIEGNLDDFKTLRPDDAICNTVPMSLLLMACARGDYDWAKAIVDSNPASVKPEENLLVEAICSPADEKDTCKIVELLLDNGADPNRMNKNGFTPLKAAFESGCPKVATLLLRSGAEKLSERLFAFRSLASFETFLAVGGSMSPATLSTLLFCVLSGGAGVVDKMRMMRQLVARGADINVRADYADLELTPLHAACGFVPDQNPGHFYHDLMVGFLLDNGADPNAAMKYGLRPLHVVCGLDVSRGPEATEEGNMTVVVDSVAMLLRCGAEVEVRDDGGLSPLQLAVKTGKRHVAEMLEEHLRKREQITGAASSPNM